MFIKIGDIKGESVDHRNKDIIRVHSWSWGAGVPDDTRERVRGGKLRTRPIHVTKSVDRSTPTLWDYLVNRRPIEKCVLVVREGGEKPVDRITIELDDCLIDHISASSSEQFGNTLVENIAICFKKLTFTYVPLGKGRSSEADEDKCTEGPIVDDIYSDTITGDHIDEICRFVDANTVLLAEVPEEDLGKDPIARISRKRLEENHKILRTSTDQDGRPFRIVRMPTADPIFAQYTPKDSSDYALRFFKGSKAGKPIKYVLASSYLNFLVTNGVVLAPKYWKPGRPESTRQKDLAAKNILQRVFPHRKVIQISCEAFNHGGGGIHCNTQQEPAR